MIDKLMISAEFQKIQDSICHSLEDLDGKGKFKEDIWTRSEGGGGKTRIIEGAKIEKGGVNFSAVSGELSASSAGSLKVESGNFYATGVSIVLHPENPFVPIIHMNIRYFEMDSGLWWFGGGIDLTPHYVNVIQAGIFHRALKAICDKFNVQFYPKFKSWADDYFFIPHREETRGVGGIFFDRLNEESTGNSKQLLHDFVTELGYSFSEIYGSMVLPFHENEWTEEEKRWQHIRRGRYVEFNLVYDRGTRFGLETAGRIESILMSLPPMAEWIYNFQPENESKEKETLKWLKKGIDWTSY